MKENDKIIFDFDEDGRYLDRDSDKEQNRDGYMLLLAEAIRNSKTPPHVDLSEEEINGEDEFSKVVINALSKNTSIKSLNLENNGIGNKGIMLLCKSLKVNKHIKKLNLSRNQIDTKSIKLICENSTITSLILQCICQPEKSSNYYGPNTEPGNISNDGIKYLYANKLLTSLDISWNNVSPTSEIFNSLNKTNLISLNINGISNDNKNPKNIGQLTESLKMNEKLTSLGLGRLINDSNAGELCQSLEKNTTLKSLDLIRNKLSNESMEYFCKMLEKNTSLRSLDLMGGMNLNTKEGHRFLESLYKVLETTNRTITTITLDTVDDEIESDYDIPGKIRNLLERNQQLNVTDALKTGLDELRKDKPKSFRIPEGIVGEISGYLYPNMNEDRDPVKDDKALEYLFLISKEIKKQHPQPQKKEGKQKIPFNKKVPMQEKIELREGKIFLTKSSGKGISFVDKFCQPSMEKSYDMQEKIELREGKIFLTKSSGKGISFVDKFCQPSMEKSYDDLEDGIYMLKGGMKNDKYVKSDTPESDGKVYYFGIEKKGKTITFKEICHFTAGHNYQMTDKMVNVQENKYLNPKKFNTTYGLQEMMFNPEQQNAEYLKMYILGSNVKDDMDNSIRINPITRELTVAKDKETERW